jgi:hypothetical protein
MLLPIAYISAFALSAFQPEVKLLGALAIPCSAEILAEADSSRSPACYSVNAGHPLRLDLDAGDSGDRINAWRFGIRAVGNAVGSASGQYIDGAGRESWTHDFTLPRSGDKTRMYEVAVEIESGVAHEERVFHIENVVRQKSESAWTIAGTNIRLGPSGCWKEAPEILVALSLQSCTDKSRALKAVAANLIGGISLREYVTHSIEVYSRAGVWRVGQRRPIPAALGEGERVILVQTIGPRVSSVNKYFIHDGPRVVIVTSYGNGIDAPDPGAWLSLTAADHE